MSLKDFLDISLPLFEKLNLENQNIAIDVFILYSSKANSSSIDVLETRNKNVYSKPVSLAQSNQFIRNDTI